MGDLDLAGLKAMLAAATPGPYDISSGLLRAIRGDRAVPMFEVREIWWDPERPAPTVRYCSGKVQFRAGSQAAKIAHAFKMEGRNLRAVHAALSTLPTLIQRIEELEEALKQIELLSTNHGGWFEDDAWKWGSDMGNIATSALTPTKGR